MTMMSEKVISGILSGVVEVSDFFTGSLVNSKAGQKFFSLLPGEVVLASLDGFSKFISNLFHFQVQYLLVVYHFNSLFQCWI